MLRIHKKKRMAFSALVAAVFVLPTLVFAISKLVATDNSFAITYEMPAGYTSMHDPYLYDCAVTWFRKKFMSEEIPATGLTDEQLTRISQLTCYGTVDEKITDATGIEKMSTLEYLDLGSNAITSITLPQNNDLYYLDLHENQLTTVDVSHNPNLSAIHLYSNQLSSINVASNTALRTLDVSSNNLSSLDVTHNTALRTLKIYSNHISSIDISHNSLLSYLSLYDNQLTFLDISNNSRIRSFSSDNIVLYTGIVPTKDGNNFVYDLSGMQFIADDNYEGFDVDFSISNTSSYSYNEANMLLTVNDIVGAGEFVQISGDVEHFSYKLKLPHLLDFNLNGGTGTVEIQGCQTLSAASGSCDVTIPNIVPTRNGFNFIGWAESSTATSANYNAGDTVTLSGSKILYAVWQEESTTVSLSFDLNGGQGGVAAQSCGITLTASSCNVTIPSTIPSKNGYSFAGWANSSTATSANYNPGDTVSLTGNKTIYAVWTLVTTTVTLNFNANGGQSSPAAQSCTISVLSPTCSVTIPSATPSRNGYTFLGWAESNTATTPSYSAGSSVTLDNTKTLYAVWSLVTNTVTLSFNTNGADGSVASQSCTVSVESTSCNVTIPNTELSRDGYTFLGWAENSSATGANYENGDTVSISSNKTLYAVWRLNTTTLTLSFDLNGGEGNVAAQTCTISILNSTCDVTIPSTIPTKEGYDFVAWEHTADTAVARYGAGDTFTLSDNTTVSAVWEESEEEPGDDTPKDDTSDEEESDIPVPNTSAPDTGANTMTNGGAVFTLAIAPVMVVAAYAMIHYLNRKKA